MKQSNPVFHGSNLIVEEPKIIIGKYTKDFGPGFYLTESQSQANRWAKNKARKFGGNPTTSIYRFNYDYANKMNVKYFEVMTDEWLDFIAYCRHGDIHSYDIVEGPMADDEIYNHIEEFLSGQMTREEFWNKARFKYPTHQILLANEDALKCISFIGSYIVK